MEPASLPALFQEPPKEDLALTGVLHLQLQQRRLQPAISFPEAQPNDAVLQTLYEQRSQLEFQIAQLAENNCGEAHRGDTETDPRLAWLHPADPQPENNMNHALFLHTNYDTPSSSNNGQSEESLPSFSRDTFQW